MKVEVIFVLIVVLVVGFTYKQLDKPVGLAVIIPDTLFFECARAVHGNYRFYYDQDSKEYRFDRAGEICSVNTMQFRKRYLQISKVK